jgi:natural product precursor
MSPKQFSRKLILNKKTIANLNNGEMNNVKGGTVPTSGITKCTVYLPCNYPTYYPDSCGTFCYTDTRPPNPCWACV